MVFKYGVYMFISFFFTNISFILKNIFSKNGILLSIITIAHVYFSYRGFQLLESGTTYPLMILLLAGENINFTIIFALIGVYLLAHNSSVKETLTFQKSDEKERFNYEGIIMMLLAALIYFVVRDIKTTNNWNHLYHMPLEHLY